MLGGGVWHLFRFALVTALVYRAIDPGQSGHLNLLWVGAPALLMAALFAASAFVKGGDRFYLPLLRIGSLLTVVSDSVVVFSGSYVPTAEQIGVAGDPLGRLVFVIVYGILAVDLLILAALISYRPMDRSGRDDRPDHRPPFDATSVEEE